jgi:hypothetical protein
MIVDARTCCEDIIAMDATVHKEQRRRVFRRSSEGYGSNDTREERGSLDSPAIGAVPR